MLVGVAPGGSPPASHGSVRFARFFTPALGAEKRYVIYLPPSYAAARQRRVQYAEWPGKQEWRYWHEHVGESMRWLAERIAR